MATEIEIQVMKSETVKPSSPTPEDRRSYKLSLLDQFCPTHRTPILLFYPRTSDVITIYERLELLIKSLSQTLTRFYPFAGRLRDNTSIDCNDEGAEFVATRVHCLLSEILENPGTETLTKFVPNQTLLEGQLLTCPLLLVKVNFFDCGGMAIGVCLSHKSGDASTISTFLNSWAAATAKSKIESALIPQFVSSVSIFPPLESLVSFIESSQVPDSDEKIKVKRLVFHGPRIEALRSKAASDSSVPNPTRVEAVSALIWKCAIEASTLPNQRISSFNQTVNIRTRIEPSLPESSVGNLLWFFHAEIMNSSEGNKTELKDLVVLLRKGIDEVKAMCKLGIPPEAIRGCIEEMSKQKNGDGVHRLAASSWCRFPLYDVDFGWGKPEWVCIPNMSRMKNAFAMMDARDGHGIEVLLWLCEEEMNRFERNQELLAFASLDPSIIN